MKKTYTFTFLLLLTMQSMVAERRGHFLRTLCIDFKAFIQGNASEEQKERLVKQAAAMILAGSISLYCVVVFGAVRDGEKVPLPFKYLAKLAKEKRTGDDQSSSPPPIASSVSMRNLFAEPAPSPFSALRDDPPLLDRLKSVRGLQGRRRPTRKPFSVRKRK